MEAGALRAPAALNRISSVTAPLLRLRSDEQLVALFRAGNDAAFSVIHDRYRQRLFVYSRQMLGGSRQDAEDALQDVFLRAYSSLRVSDRPVSLRAWLYRVAHNRCIDHLRKPVPPAIDLFETSRRPLHDPTADAERRDDLRRLIADIRRLPEQQRSALLMREMDGLSYAELAEVLGVSLQAVKSLLVRARIGLVEAVEARDTACVEIRADLADAFDRGVRASGRSRKHLRDCAGCTEYRAQLRGVRHGLAALSPGPGPLAAALKLLGIGGAAGGGAASSGAAAGGGAIVVAGGGTAAKVTAVVCCAALAAGGAAEVTHQIIEPSHGTAGDRGEEGSRHRARHAGRLDPRAPHRAARSGGHGGRLLAAQRHARSAGARGLRRHRDRPQHDVSDPRLRARPRDEADRYRRRRHRRVGRARRGERLRPRRRRPDAAQRAPGRRRPRPGGHDGARRRRRDGPGRHDGVVDVARDIGRRGHHRHAVARALTRLGSVVGIDRYLATLDHETLLVRRGRRSGCFTIVAVHSTARGPSLGGCRMWHYADARAAVRDALRLSQAMTFKSAVAGLPLGGGKGVIMAPDPATAGDREWRADALLDFGDTVESLGGSYVTAEDVGTSSRDMETIASVTSHVSGLARRLGGSGDPSPWTALGVQTAIELCCERRLRIAVAGGPDDRDLRPGQRRRPRRHGLRRGGRDAARHRHRPAQAGAGATRSAPAGWSPPRRSRRRPTSSPRAPSAACSTTTARRCCRRRSSRARRTTSSRATTSPPCSPSAACCGRRTSW